MSRGVAVPRYADVQPRFKACLPLDIVDNSGVANIDNYTFADNIWVRANCSNGDNDESAVQCSTVQCSAVRCSTVQYNAVQCCVV